jgi:hypothetical protein
VGKPKERDHLQDRSVDGRLGLEWIYGDRLGRWGGGGVDSHCSGY